MPLSHSALRVLAALQVVVMLSAVTIARWGHAPAPAAQRPAGPAPIDLPPRIVALPPAAPAALPELVDRADRGGGRTPVATGRTVTPAAPATPALQLRGEQALRSLRYDWRALGYTIRFEPYTGGTLGTTHRTRRLITIHVKRGQSELSLRATIAHELGHALDFTHGTTQRRQRYRQVRGLSPHSPWFPCNRCDDLGSPAGDFAESFAAWLFGAGDFRGRLRPAPTAAELRQLAPLFALPAPTEVGSQPAAPSPAPSPSPAPEDEGPLVVVLPDRPTPAPGARRSAAA
jgi:hypothetical protein